MQREEEWLASCRVTSAQCRVFVFSLLFLFFKKSETLVFLWLVSQAHIPCCGDVHSWLLSAQN